MKNEKSTSFTQVNQRVFGYIANRETKARALQIFSTVPGNSNRRLAVSG